MAGGRLGPPATRVADGAADRLPALPSSQPTIAPVPASWSCLTRSADATARVARALGRAMEPVPRGGLFVALLGDLGAGKTVFAGGLFRGLGVSASVPVVSPTFTVARAYRGRMPIHHVDAYHVLSLAELEAAGFEEMGGDGHVTCVEWGDRVPEALPADRLEVSLRPEPDALADAAAPCGKESEAEPPRRIDVLALGRGSSAVLSRALPLLEEARAEAAAR